MERQRRVVAGSRLVFAVFDVISPPSNNTGSLLLRLERLEIDI